MFFSNISEFRESTKQGQQQRKYYRLNSKNFESIDGYIHPNIIFQIPVAEKHGIKQDDLREFREVVDRNDICIYFVLPKKIFETFDEQPYENNGNNERFDDCINNIKQYALYMDLDML